MKKSARTRKITSSTKTRQYRKKSNKEKYPRKFFLFFSSISLLTILIIIPVILMFSSVPRKTTHIALQKQEAKKLSLQELYAVERQKLVTLLREKDPRIALQTLEKVTKENTSLLRMCHPLVHELGREAYRKYQDFAKVLEYRNEICGSGYIHGAVEAKFFSANDIISELQTTCSSMDGSCLHGMGHGLMFFTKNDLPRALFLCESLSGALQRGFCAEGVFMENFNTDQKMHVSQYLNPRDPFYPCTDATIGYKATCYFYAPLYYLTLHNFDAVKALDWCTRADPPYQFPCANGVGSRTMKVYVDTPKTVERFCMSAENTLRLSCIDGMIGYYMVHHFSAEKGETLCDRLESVNKPTCLAAVAKRAHLFPN